MTSEEKVKVLWVLVVEFYKRRTLLANKTCAYTTHDTNAHWLTTVLRILAATVQKENSEIYFSDISHIYDFNTGVSTFTFSVLENQDT